MTPTERLHAYMPELRDLYRVTRIGIFGSFAREDANDTSDVDILVEFDDHPDLFQFIRLQERLSKILGREIDLVTPDALKPLIKDRVLREVRYI